jgi:serine/threonine protein kinase
MSGIAFGMGSGPHFTADLGSILTEGKNAFWHTARAESGETAVPEVLVVKQAKPGFERLLDRESEAAARADHPSVMRFLGSGRSLVHGQLLAYERLAKSPLILMNEGIRRPRFRDPETTYFPLPPGRALELAFDLLLAIEYLHSRKLVHGDVKVSSLLVRTPSPTSEAEQVLTDVSEGAFEGVLAGFAQLRAIGAPSPPLEPNVFTAPEAIETGSSPEADTYAAGLVFYTLLTGRLPYDEQLKPAELRHPDVVRAIKARERNGEIRPWLPEAIDRIPLHDVAFVGPAATVWPSFRSSVVHLLGRCLSSDPARRPSSHEVRQAFENDLRLRPSGSSAIRPWSQKLFQMRPVANRLTGDQPAAGISIRLQEGDLVVEERRAPPTPLDLATRRSLAVGDGSTLQFKVDDHAAETSPGMAAAAKKGRPTAPRGMNYLADVLREFQAKRPLLVSCPVLLTTTTFGPRDLVRCLVFSLGRVHTRMLIADTGAEEKVRVSVGRGEDNDIVLADTSVSKQHLVLERKAGRWWVEDLRSTNGTTVEGILLAPGARTRIQGRMATIGLGEDATLTFMEEPELNGYLAQALDAWNQAFGKKVGLDRTPFRAQTPTASQPRPTASPAGATPATGRPRPASSGLVEPPTQLFESVAAAKPPEPAAPTTKFRRDVAKEQVKRVLEKADEPRPAKAPLPDDLEKRLSRYATAPRFRVTLDGSRVEFADSVAATLALVRAAPDQVESIQVELASGGRLPVFVRTVAPG